MIMVNGSVISIMLVEDDEVDVMNLKRAFKKNNINNPLYLAENGLDALEILRKCGTDDMPMPKIILLDLNMPKMNGLEMVEEINGDQQLRGVPIIMLTTEGSGELIERARAAGAKGWLVKPFKPDQLIAAVSKLTA